MDLQIKKAETSVPIFPVLEDRWSPRAFKDVLVEDGKIEKMMEAMRWGPSAGNTQPWRVIVGKKGDSNWRKIFEGLVIGNQVWCKDAPLLMVIVGKILKADGGKFAYSMYDCGGAAAQINFQASVDGLYTHQMAGFEGEKIKKLFDIPLEYHPYSVIACGYLGEPESLKEDLIEREKAERIRLPLSDLVFRTDSNSDFWKV